MLEADAMAAGGGLGALGRVERRVPRCDLRISKVANPSSSCTMAPFSLSWTVVLGMEGSVET